MRPHKAFTRSTRIFSQPCKKMHNHLPTFALDLLEHVDGQNNTTPTYARIYTRTQRKTRWAI